VTYSVVARCADTGMFGIAIATAVPAVGSMCPHVASGVGAVVTQAWTNPFLGLDGLELLANGYSAEQALVKLVEGDPGRSLRQLAVVDHHGTVAAHSGSECSPYFGHLLGDGYSVQGNLLTGEETLTAMAEQMDRPHGSDLPQRLLDALHAGQLAGGDRRGRRSAAIKVYGAEDYPYMDLRVDDHAQPVEELLRLGGIWRRQILPLLEAMPTRANPLGLRPPAVGDPDLPAS
jgi:uncharacterized Ntn-hydrolase superfamily protein